MKKFKKAQAQDRASIKKHLEANNAAYSSSDDEDLNDETLQQTVDKVFINYQNDGADTEKFLSYLTDVCHSGASICLVCISSVKKGDAIWSCSTCYSFLHLPCIQHWIRDSLTYKKEKGIKPLWACPKCRTEYEESEIPTRYYCFCGKTEDPPYQAWNLPHSCGELCGKLLQPKCGHKCTLLCHPGPCPPCPKIVLKPCYCNKQSEKPRRCSSKEWSCGNACGAALSCGHACQAPCHPGSCPPCSETSNVPCNCGAKKEVKLCSERDWRCEKACNRKLNCNVHCCEGFCHRQTDCGPCPFEKNRTCPCGKKKYAISCKQQTTPTCGDTCGKLLDCKAHFCNMRCHADKCGQCIQVVKKVCRCESFSKEIACGKEFHCNRKCTQMRLCGRHPCNKKCCDCLIKNNFNVCEKTCDTMLNCRKHKCSAPCHSGPCYPCPRTIVIQCRCGGSKITVPCGTVKKIKPPPCNRMCKIPPVCHHPKRESHKCHQGACPPCKKVCAIKLRCGHTCPAVCHTKVWMKVKVNGVTQPVGPWDTPQETWEKKTLPCPPCEVSVMVSCLGEHECKPWPCHMAKPTSCLRECGQLLACSNHTCEKLCHKIEDGCLECEKPCALDRPAGCTHSCDKICHPAPCAPCRQMVRVQCHCAINVLYFRCSVLTSASAEDKLELFKCGNQCPKNYKCGHRCVDNCHPGPCEKEELCNKKVKIWCKCKRIKKEFSCKAIRLGQAEVSCDEVCKQKKIEMEKIKEEALAKKRKEEELRNQKEIEQFERKFKPKKKGRDRHRLEQSSDDANSNLYRVLMTSFVIILASVIGLFYYTNYVLA